MVEYNRCGNDFVTKNQNGNSVAFKNRHCFVNRCALTDDGDGITDLEERATSVRTIRPNNEEFLMPDGRRIFLLARGRLVNLAAAEGHPSEVMDMSFANQFLSLCRLAKEGASMGKEVYDITKQQDQDLATTKLETLGFSIDVLTDAQLAYLDDYTVGT